MNEVFYEIYSNLPRQGPGDVMVTLECFKKITPLDNPLKVLDIGCGTGFQTIFMAINSNFEITAIDNHQPFIDELQQKANMLGLNNRLKAINMDMDNLDFESEKFDIILSEGSAYIITIEKALKEWKKFLKKGGYLIFSDLCWLKEVQKSELTDFWAKEYPTMTGIEEIRKLIAKSGYNLINEQILTPNAWVNNYYYPLELNVIKARQKYMDNPEFMKIVNWIQKEIDIFYKYYDNFTYCFFVCQPNI